MFTAFPITFMTGAAEPAVLTFTDEEGDQGGSSPWTFTGMSIGTASADRFVIVGVFAPSTSTDDSDAISGVTIGGITATRLAQATTNPGTGEENHQIAFYGATVATGTTASIVVSTNSARASMSIGVWAATGLQSNTPTDTASDVTVATNALSANIDVQAGGFILGISMTQNGGETCTWTNLTEDFDSPLSVDPATSSVQSGASDSDMSASTVTVTATWTATDAGGDNSLLLIAMR